MTLRISLLALLLGVVIGLTDLGRRSAELAVTYLHQGFLAVYVDASAFIAGCF